MGLIVCFALQGESDNTPAMSRALLACRAVRARIPDAHIVQLSNLDYPACPMADEVIRTPNTGDFIAWGFGSFIKLMERGENVLQIATDVIVQDNVSDVFEQDFDVAACVYPARDREDGAYCGDVNFCKPSSLAFWREALELYLSQKLRDGWDGGQQAFLKIAKTGKYKILALDWDTYCRTPETAHEDVSAARIVHYRGPRKSFMFLRPDAGAFPVNTSARDRMANTLSAINRGLPLFREMPPNSSTALIVGGGPSLESELTTLRYHRKRGAVTFALNGSHDYLIERGITPDFMVLADARPGNTVFLKRPRLATHYLIAAQCHPDVFEALKGYGVTVWVPYVEGLNIDAISKPIIVVTGGATVGLKTMHIAHLWGFRRLRLFGFDGCYQQGRNHAYPQPMNDNESVISVDMGGKTWTVAPWMVQQAEDFRADVKNLEREGSTIHMHGGGLLPYLFDIMHPQEKTA